MEEAFIDEGFEPVAGGEGARELQEGRFPEEGAVLDAVHDPVLDTRVLEALEGADVGEVVLLDAGEGIKEVHLGFLSCLSISCSFDPYMHDAIPAEQRRKASSLLVTTCCCKVVLLVWPFQHLNKGTETH
jgi:hypothetical protein